MNISTEFDVGDTVFYMRHNRVERNKINSIKIEIQSLNTQKSTELGTKMDITYHISGVDVMFRNENLFRSKEELLKSL